MFDRIKNLKLVSKANEVSPKLKWLMYDGIRDYKINSNYLEMLTGEQGTGLSHSKLEAMVRDMIKQGDEHWKNFIAPENHHIIEEYFSKKKGII